MATGKSCHSHAQEHAAEGTRAWRGGGNDRDLERAMT